MSAQATSSQAAKLSQSASQILERYLRDVRMSLRGCGSVDPAEVEADVRQHIEHELAEADSPVSGAELGGVLTKLGSPMQWVPIEELPWWRRAALQLRTGSKADWMALIVFLTLFVGVLLFYHIDEGGFVILASFVLARAVVAMCESVELPLSWRKWLVYPSLLVVYVPALGIGLGWAIFAGSIPVGIGIQWSHQLQHQTPLTLQLQNNFTACAVGAAGLGIWWMILASVLLAWPTLVGWLFHPLVQRMPRKLAWVLFWVGLAVTVAGGAVAASLLMSVPT